MLDSIEKEQNIKESIEYTMKEIDSLIDKLVSKEKTIDRLHFAEKLANNSNFMASLYNQLIALENDRVARELANNYKRGDITC